MFQSRSATPPRCPPDGFYADTSIHLDIDDPARAGNWLLAFFRKPRQKKKTYVVIFMKRGRAGGRDAADAQPGVVPGPLQRCLRPQSASAAQAILRGPALAAPDAPRRLPHRGSYSENEIVL